MIIVFKIHDSDIQGEKISCQQKEMKHLKSKVARPSPCILLLLTIIFLKILSELQKRKKKKTLCVCVPMSVRERLIERPSTCLSSMGSVLSPLHLSTYYCIFLTIFFVHIIN